MSKQPHRRPAGGRIDRARPLTFTFDGRRYGGYAGDTLASALLANGVHLVGRSFKYHRPRGIVAAGAEEPNALVQLGLGGRTEPNRRATQIELRDGLVAASQNAWPSIGFDLGAVNDRLSPLFPAGFYYKTFMRPAALWTTYERFIRRAAGMGRAPSEPDPDRYEHTYAHCDVLVVGAGPAGLMAALAAGRAGARVILADEQTEPGGALLAEPDEGGVRIGGEPAAAWLVAVVAELASLPELRLLRRTTVFGYYDHNFLGLLEEIDDPAAVRQRLWKVRARRVVLATGAIERPIVFPGNDRPGVMLAGAVRAYVNRYAVLPGRRAVVFATNDGAYATALDLHRAGVEVAAVVDPRPEPERGEMPGRVWAAGLRLLPGRAVIATEGARRLRGVRVAALDGGETARGEAETIACDLLAVSGGWNPAVHLFSQSRGRLRFEPERGVFLPGEAVQAQTAAGACNGAFALAECLAQGAAAGLEAARAAGFEETTPVDVPPVEEPAEAPMRVLWRVRPPEGRPRGKAFVDLQNDVTAADLELAVREGYRSIEHVKRYTTTGMGTDQGKTANVNALAIVAGATGASIPEVGTTTFRPPYTPVTFGAVVGANRGHLFDVTRVTPIHPWHEAHGAAFEDVGQWKRAWYYPRPGETMHEAVRRECRAAREAVGMLDASTLGKIDIQGPDAAELLNRVYTNAWSKLEVGRCRYGLMLRDDGMVFDDGVTARLGEHHYLMSTTTGNAARVLAWLEEWLQTEWPELRVYLTSVTEQYATVQLCGPRCRDVLRKLTGIDLSPNAFPHMSMQEGEVAGVAARVFRVSFTGEVSYEVNVLASYGLALWEACMAAGAEFGIAPFGTETMHVLRAEKGYIIVGQETDGTVTPLDLGMDWIIGKRKPDFIGKRSLARPDMLRPDRKQLVGLRPTDPAEVLEEGAPIVERAGERPPPVPMVGHVTSSYDSPNVGGAFALALVKGGRDRIGRTLYVPMPDNRTIEVRVVEPVFFDPEGERLRA